MAATTDHAAPALAVGFGPAAFGLAAAICLAGSVSCDPADATGTRPGDEADRPVPVEVHQVELSPFREHVSISANILPKRQVKIVPRVPGRLERVFVDEGDRVEADQIVAQLDRRDYLLGVRQAQAQLAAARANAQLASVGLDSASSQKQRMQKLRENDAIPQSRMEKVVDGHRMGQANQKAADAQAQVARVGVDAARTKLTDTVLRAPFAGLVVKQLLDEGEICAPMPPAVIMIVADMSAAKVMGSVGELQVARLRLGMAATVRVDALPGESFAGTVELVSPMVDARTRTATVHITVPNDSGRLEMGMSAEIEIDLGERRVVAVPDDVLLRDRQSRDRAHVFVVNADGVARRTEISLGPRQGDSVEVREGLSPGSRVVRSGQSTLRDGQSVTIRTGRRGSDSR